MPIKSVVHPTSGKTISFGRKHPAVDFPCLRLKNYTMKSLPSPPASVDYYSPAMAALDKVYLNDSLGDCVIACQSHLVGVFTGNAGTPPVIFTDGQIESRYSHIGGYVPGDPSTDNGCDMQTALASWENVGMMPMHLPLNKHKIQGWLKVTPSDFEELRTSVWLFENLDIGLDLPDPWVNPFPSSNGFTWDVAGDPDPNNGHCVAGVGYNSTGVQICTWGLVGTMTWAAIAKYCDINVQGELYTVISKDSIDRAKLIAPNGFNWAQLQADFAAIHG